VNIPKPNEFAKDGGYKPFPPRWERWLSSVREAILTAQPQAGRWVTVDEHPGQGTVINAAGDASSRRDGGGGGGGPVTGACCDVNGDCTITTEAACTDDGGTWQGAGTDCDPNPCPEPPPPCNCAFFNPDDGKSYLTRISNYVNEDCPTLGDNCMYSETGLCVDPTRPCPYVYYGGTRVESLISSEHYEEDCEITTNYDDFILDTYCFCCPPDCVNPAPPFAADCGLTSTYTYEDECTPV
jgi:hypothetical protein